MTFNGLLFGTACGNLLPRVGKSKAPQNACDLCGTLTTNEWPDQTSTYSRQTDYPSTLQRKRNRFATLSISQDIASAQQITNGESPQRRNIEMQFRQAQMRGAERALTSPVKDTMKAVGTFATTFDQ